MYNFYKNIAEGTIKKYDLDQTEIEAIYRLKEMEYRTEDVKCHAEDLFSGEMISEKERDAVCENAEVLAERYIFKCQDCTLPENDVFEYMIEEFIRDNK